MMASHLRRIVSIIWNNGGRYWSLAYFLVSVAILHKWQIARMVGSIDPIGGRRFVRTLFAMSPVWALAPITILVLVAFYREVSSLERRLNPRLGIGLLPRDKCMILTRHAPGSEDMAKLVRVQVVNRSSMPIKGCRAYLVDVQNEGGGGSPPPLEYGDSLQLEWSTREGEDHIELPGNVPQYVNVLCAERGANRLRILRDGVPHRYQDLFKEAGLYRLRVAVSGEAVPTETVEFVIRWPGIWDHLELQDAIVTPPTGTALLRRASA